MVRPPTNAWAPIETGLSPGGCISADDRIIAPSSRAQENFVRNRMPELNDRIF